MATPSPVQPRRGWLSAWDLIPLTLAVLLFTAWPWLTQGLPDPLPTHFDAHNRANGWTPLSRLPRFFFGLPLFTWGLLWAVGISSAGKEGDLDGRKARALEPLRGLMAGAMFILMLSMLAIPRWGMASLWVALALFLMVMGWALRLTLRGLKALADPEELRHLRLGGLLYINPDDPRVWVSKTLGVGWTLNFAHAESWWILAILLLPALVIMLVTRLR